MSETLATLDLRAAAPLSSTSRRAVRRLLSVPEVGALVPLIVLTTIFAIIAPSMLNLENVQANLRYIVFLALVAIGEAMLLIAGELDLSVGSVAGLGSILSAWLMKNTSLSPVVAIAITVLAGSAVGLINGLITVGLGVPAFIASLGMFYIAREVAYLISPPLYGLPPAIKAFGAARPLGLSWTFFILIAMLLSADLFMRFTVFGRKIYATGGNLEVARVAGINTSRVKIFCFILTGTLAALSGSLLAAQFNIGQPEAGVGWELDVIAGVVIGGTSLFGGVGTVAGVFLGLLLMQVVRSGLVQTDTPSHWQGVAIGSIMIVAVYIDLLRRRAKI